MKRKKSATNYTDELIFAKLDYMLALAKLIVAETRYRNSLYARSTVQAALNNYVYTKKRLRSL